MAKLIFGNFHFYSSTTVLMAHYSTGN